MAKAARSLCEFREAYLAGNEIRPTNRPF